LSWLEHAKVIVIGMGHVGKPLYEIIRGKYEAEWLDIEPKDISGTFDIMHICYPYSNVFVEQTAGYIRRFKPKLTLIESTVLPGTTMKIYEKTKAPICHSPIKGREADGMKRCILWYTKFIGSIKREWAETAAKYYESLGFKTYICDSPLETEFAKIINTTYYGILIAWFQEIYRICKEFKLNYKQVVEFIRRTEEGGHPRPVMKPGIIGGHCVIPNAELLYRKYKSKFIEALLESNEKFKEKL